MDLEHLKPRFFQPYRVLPFFKISKEVKYFSIVVAVVGCHATNADLPHSGSGEEGKFIKGLEDSIVRIGTTPQNACM